MLFDTEHRGEAASAARRPTAATWRLISRASGRLSWGLADQGMSSLSNFAVNIITARSLGAVQYGAFALAYVTYGFALNASRGLATTPLLVRFSGTDIPTWRRAIAKCTGTATTVGLTTGAIILAVAALLNGTTRLAFLALGLTMPGLALQDSWRYSFFALGRGSQAFLNDTVWTVTLIPVLVLLRKTGHSNVFWFVLAWGLAATVAAAIGPLQARTAPRISLGWEWVSRHRDLGPRYAAEGTASNGSAQLRNYGVTFILGLAAVGYLQAATTLMGPFYVIYWGMGLVTLPEAARILRRSPRNLPLFCLLVTSGLTILALGWGVVLAVALPRGLGHLMLGRLWKHVYPLVWPTTMVTLGSCAGTGAGTGLHALGAARRSLAVMVAGTAVSVVFSIAGAAVDGVVGAMIGYAAGSWTGALLSWWQLVRAMRESGGNPTGAVSRPTTSAWRRRRTADEPARQLQS
jgi:O-antigen/teichoic acid export membrane protein